MKVDALIAFYHGISPERIASLPEFYAADAWFKDPFNEVRGVTAIQQIFRHMYRQVDDPQFLVTEKLVDGNGALLVWEFRFRSAGWGKGETQCMHGVSHLRFDAEGKVAYHRDYWDTGQELYSKIPLLGALMRLLRRKFAA